MFEKKFTIESIDVDEFGTLKLSALFKYIQLVAGDAIQSAGIGQDALMQEGLLWVLTRIQIKVNKWPKWQDKIIFKTYPNDNIKFIYPRHFIIYDNNGEEIIRIVSTWSLINKYDRKISMYDLHSFKDFIVEKHDDELPLPSKLILKSEPTYSYSNTVRYTDCDINRHLNNTRYIDYILDVKKSSFYKDYFITDFQIQYEHELLEEDVVNLYTFEEDNKLYVLGKKNDVTSFLALLQFSKRKYK